jgi:hypothetical protein
LETVAEATAANAPENRGLCRRAVYPACGGAWRAVRQLRRFRHQRLDLFPSRSANGISFHAASNAVRSYVDNKGFDSCSKRGSNLDAINTANGQFSMQFNNDCYWPIVLKKSAGKIFGGHFFRLQYVIQLNRDNH